MTLLHRLTFLLSASAVGLVSACGGSSHNGADAPLIDSPTPVIDAPPDAPNFAGVVFTIPLSSPANADQGFFYTPTVTASGNSFLLDLDTGSTDTGIAGNGCGSAQGCPGLSPLYTPGSNATELQSGGSAVIVSGSSNADGAERRRCSPGGSRLLAPRGPPAVAAGRQERSVSFQATSRSSRGSPGRPSTRSPMIVRCTSEVPPSIELASERRYAFLTSAPPCTAAKSGAVTLVLIDRAGQLIVTSLTRDGVLAFGASQATEARAEA